MKLQYDPGGVPNGLLWKTALLGLETTRTYDGIGRVSTLSTADVGSSFAYSFGLTYSATYRIGTLAESLSVPGVPPSIEWEYSYDAAARLIGAERRTGQETTTWSYVYDANGNRIQETIDGVTVTADYDARDRLVSRAQGATTFTYDWNGNLAAQQTGSLVTVYDYDALGRLRGVSLPGGDEITYDLDVVGRRVAKRLNGALVDQWAYLDFLRPVAELDGSTVSALYVYAGEHHAPSFMVKGGETYRLLTNAQGSVRLVVNAATGQVVQRMEYDPFGRIIEDTSPGFQPFGFAGGLYDPDTGLVHFGHREYDPDTGRWTSIDPIQLAGGDTNYYAYVANDPVNYFDPTGLFLRHFVGPLPIYRPVDPALSRAILRELYLEMAEGIAQYPPMYFEVGIVQGLLRWVWNFRKIKRAAKVAKTCISKGGLKALPAPKPHGNLNTAPEYGPFTVSPKGDAVPTPPGGRAASSPDGRFIQALDANGKPTGVRLDGAHNPLKHPDPRAQQPHGHVPGMTNPDGTPWLPVK